MANAYDTAPETSLTTGGFQNWFTTGLNVYGFPWTDLDFGYCIDAPEFMPAGSTRRGDQPTFVCRPLGD